MSLASSLPINQVLVPEAADRLRHRLHPLVTMHVVLDTESLAAADDVLGAVCREQHFKSGYAPSVPRGEEFLRGDGEKGIGQLIANLLVTCGRKILDETIDCFHCIGGMQRREDQMTCFCGG